MSVCYHSGGAHEWVSFDTTDGERCALRVRKIVSFLLRQQDGEAVVYVGVDRFTRVVSLDTAMRISEYAGLAPSWMGGEGTE